MFQEPTIHSFLHPLAIKIVGQKGFTILSEQRNLSSHHTVERLEWSRKVAAVDDDDNETFLISDVVTRAREQIYDCRKHGEESASCCCKVHFSPLKSGGSG